MAVSGLNLTQANKIDLIKSALAKKSVNSHAAQKPSYMKMSGSIFLAPGAAAKVGQNSTLNDNNIIASLNELNKNSYPQETKTESNTNSDKKSNIMDIINGGGSKAGKASAGRKAAAEGEKQGKELKAQTAQVENDNKVVSKYGKDAQKLDKSINKDDKKFKTTFNKETKKLEEDNKKIENFNKENEKLQTEIEAAQNELESLQATSSFSIGGENKEKINDLQQIIGAKVGKLQANGKTVYSLQRNTQRTIRSMQSTNRQYVKTQQRHQRDIKAQQSETSGIIKFADNVEKYSALTSQVGQTLDLGGKALVALGTATSWLGIGGALITAGNIMQKVGTVVKMIGDYGQVTANITKTAAFAAEGNLAGALQSATAAYQSGAAAIKATTGMKETFGKINESTNNAKQQLASNVEAKAQVESIRTSEMKKLAEEKGIDTTGMSTKEIEKAVGGKNVVNERAFGTDINNNVISTKQATNATRAQLKAQTKKLGFGTGNANIRTIDNAIKENSENAFENAKKLRFNNIASKVEKTSCSIDFGKLASAGAAALGQKPNNTSVSTPTIKAKKARPDYRLSQRAYDIKARNDRQRAHTRAYM